MFRTFRFVESAVLFGAMGCVTAVAQTQAPTSTGMPDAQVEANVLKALAGAPDLASQAITTTTVYGVVTLSGSVETEAMRTHAETIASRTSGVKKVVDEMTLGVQAANPQPMAQAGDASNDAQGTQPMLQSDGTMAPQQPAQSSPGVQNAPNEQPAPSPASGPNYAPGAPEYRQPYTGPRHAPPPPDYSQQQGYPQQQQGYPQQQQGYPQQQSGYSQQQGYPQQGYPQQQQAYGPPPAGYGQNQPYNGGTPQAYGGQQAGQMVTVPSGALLRIRINQTLDSRHAKPGDHFDGVVVSDVAADGAVAIPRGALVSGTVVDAKPSGVLAGRGELSLQLTQITLGGRVYPLIADVWAHNGGDKTVQTVNSTAIGGGVGALLGAAAGGGEGAAIGAGVGAALGLGSSAASGRGQVYVPAEGLLTFHVTQPTTVATVSQQEMDRMAQGIGPAGGPRPLVRRYPTPYYGPAYYRPYPYPYAYPYPY